MTHGYKTKFLRWDGTTYVQVAGLIDFEPNEVTRDSTDDTHLDDTDGYQAFKPGPLRNPGEVSITLEWDQADSGQTALAADLDLDDNVQYQVEYPEGTTVSFVGHIISWGQAVSAKEKITRTVKFKLSGKPTVA